jgi:predicted Zn-dependent protease
MTDQDKLRTEKYLSHARGWLGLGKIDEAAKALEEVPFSQRLTMPVVAMRCSVYMAAEKWDVVAMLAKKLIEADPDCPAHWIHLGCAVRRTESVAAAEKILLEAQAKFPDCAAIYFNLACYASLQGKFDQVASLLGRASVLEPEFKAHALEDPDLEPYWRSLKPPEKS